MPMLCFPQKNGSYSLQKQQHQLTESNTSTQSLTKKKQNKKAPKHLPLFPKQKKKTRKPQKTTPRTSTALPVLRFRVQAQDRTSCHKLPRKITGVAPQVGCSAGMVVNGVLFFSIDNLIMFKFSKCSRVCFVVFSTSLIMRFSTCLFCRQRSFFSAVCIS